MTTGAPFLEISGLKKRFGATAALDGLDLTVRNPEVHAIIGENGAGKTTLMNILSASIQPDAGSVIFRGRPFPPIDSLEARRLGVAHIHQELSLCPHLSVAENIFLGMEPQRGGWLDQRRLNESAAELLHAFHHPAITANRRIADLPIAARQIVEICRALAQHASLILMDEPTSSLQKSDIERLFSFIRQLRASGICVIYISHFLEEVRETADHCTVLRDGRSVLSGAISELSDRQLIAAMVGRAVDDLLPARFPARSVECVLQAENVSALPTLRNASFQLCRGEILGIAGLIGSGRTELLRAIFGLDKPSSGTITLSGQRLTLSGGPRCRMALGMGYLSEDRKREGLALSLSAADNITLTNFESCSHRGWINLTKQARQAQRCADSVQLRGAGMTAPADKLSGGNQQKLALARLLHQGCEIFLLDEPTRGVDIVSKAQIHSLIVSLARAGKAVLMVSSYLPELFGICDRLAVMTRGSLSATRLISDWTPASVMETAIGAAE